MIFWNIWGCLGGEIELLSLGTSTKRCKLPTGRNFMLPDLEHECSLRLQQVTCIRSNATVKRKSFLNVCSWKFVSKMWGKQYKNISKTVPAFISRPQRTSGIFLATPKSFWWVVTDTSWNECPSGPRVMSCNAPPGTAHSRPFGSFGLQNELWMWCNGLGDKYCLVSLRSRPLDVFSKFGKQKTESLRNANFRKSCAKFCCYRKALRNFPSTGIWPVLNL